MSVTMWPQERASKTAAMAVPNRRPRTPPISRVSSSTSVHFPKALRRAVNSSGGSGWNLAPCSERRRCDLDSRGARKSDARATPIASIHDAALPPNSIAAAFASMWTASNNRSFRHDQPQQSHPHRAGPAASCASRESSSRRA